MGEQGQQQEGDAELFLRRCCESPTIALSRMLESFLTEGVFTAWFASLFNSGGGSGSNRGSAKERKYTRTRHTVLKDEDPTYLQVITYASKLDEQCEAFARSAELYIDQLEKRVNATKLRDLGEAAL